MSILAYGTEKVKALEFALGGKPPVSASQEARAQLQRFVAKRHENQRAMHEVNARLNAPLRDRMFSHLAKDDPTIARHLEEVRKVQEAKLQRKLVPPAVTKIDPRFVIGSSFWIKVAPYDEVWTHTTAPSEAHADKVAGTYDLATQSIGDEASNAAAGVGVWFYSTTDDPMQRVAALIDYSFDWWDMASGYVAHNDLNTRISVWSATEQSYVIPHQEVPPSWSDGVGWFEDHGNSTDYSRQSVEIFFPAKANQWYLAWIWSEASVDSDSGFWGFSASSVQFSAHVPLIVFGSLF